MFYSFELLTMSPLGWLSLFLGMCGLLLPVLWMLRNWREENISSTFAIIGLVSHLFVFSLLIAGFQASPYGIVIYSSFIMLAIAFNKSLTLVRERKILKKTSDEDIAYYLQQIERQPQSAAAHAALAKVYAKNARYDEAIAEYEQAIEIDPWHSDSEQFALHTALQAKRRLEKQSCPSSPLDRLRSFEDKIRNWK